MFNRNIPSFIRITFSNKWIPQTLPLIPEGTLFSWTTSLKNNLYCLKFARDPFSLSNGTEAAICDPASGNPVSDTSSHVPHPLYSSVHRTWRFLYPLSSLRAPEMLFLPPDVGCPRPAHCWSRRTICSWRTITNTTFTVWGASPSSSRQTWTLPPQGPHDTALQNRIYHVTLWLSTYTVISPAAQ